MRRSRLQSKRTKIVCTLGPATSSTAMIEKLIMAGMNVARLNLSHGTLDEHAHFVKKIRDLSRRLGHILRAAQLPHMSSICRQRRREQDARGIG